MFKFFLVAFLAGIALTRLDADVIPFRSGEILAAELATEKPDLRNVAPERLRQYAKPCFALVVVRITPGRSISRHDYMLNVFGRKYPCIALQRGNGAFDANAWELSNLAEQDRCGMLFLIDGTTAGIDDVEVFKLAAAAPGNIPETSVPFRNKRSASLSSAGNIPADGLMPAAKP